MRDLFHPDKFSIINGYIESRSRPIYKKLYRINSCWSFSELSKLFSDTYDESPEYINIFNRIKLKYHDINGKIPTVLKRMKIKIDTMCADLSIFSAYGSDNNVICYKFASNGSLISIIDRYRKITYDRIKSYIFYYDETDYRLDIGIFDYNGTIKLISVINLKSEPALKKIMISLSGTTFIQINDDLVTYLRKFRETKRQRQLSMNRRFEMICLIIKKYYDLIAPHINPYEIYSLMRNINTILRSKLKADILHDDNILDLINQYI